MKKNDLLINISAILFSVAAGLGLGFGLGLTLPDVNDWSIYVPASNNTSEQNTSIFYEENTKENKTNNNSVNDPSTQRNSTIEEIDTGSISPGENVTFVPTFAVTPSALPVNMPINYFSKSPLVEPSWSPSLSLSLPPHFAPSIFPFKNYSSASPQIQASNAPTSSFKKSETPTQVLTLNNLKDILLPVSSRQKMDEEGSPQYRAIHWLMESKFKPTIDPNDGYYSIIQRYVLAVLYFSTDGDNWMSKYNFLSDHQLCSWNESQEGIINGVNECDENLFITKLSLVSVSMEGPLPEEIGYLHTLKELNLRENVLEGYIPASFANLKSLGLSCLCISFFFF